MVLMGYSEARGKLIHENLKLKILYQSPFKYSTVHYVQYVCRYYGFAHAKKTVAMGTGEGILDNTKQGDSGQIWNSRTALSFLVSLIFCVKIFKTREEYGFL
jgi:hypothetical protein